MFIITDTTIGSYFGINVGTIMVVSGQENFEVRNVVLWG